MDVETRRQATALATAAAVDHEKFRIQDLPPGPEKEAAWLQLEELERRAEAEADAIAVIEERREVEELPEESPEKSAAEERLHEHEMKAHAALAVVDLQKERHRYTCSPSMPSLCGVGPDGETSGRIEAKPNSPEKEAALVELSHCEHKVELEVVGIALLEEEQLFASLPEGQEKAAASHHLHQLEHRAEAAAAAVTADASHDSLALLPAGERKALAEEQFEQLELRAAAQREAVAVDRERERVEVRRALVHGGQWCGTLICVPSVCRPCRQGYRDSRQKGPSRFTRGRLESSSRNTPLCRHLRPARQRVSGKPEVPRCRHGKMSCSLL